MAFLRLAVRGDDEHAVGRGFSGAVVETSLASYPGTFFTSAPGNAQAVARYWPTTIAADDVTPRIECEGKPVAASRPTRRPATQPPDPVGTVAGADAPPSHRGRHRRGSDHRTAVGAHRREIGRQGRRRQRRAVGRYRTRGPWLCDSFDVGQFKEALPESAPFEVSRYPLPNLRAVNFVVHGILGWGVASNLRLDTQAKGMAERLRSHAVRVPASFVDPRRPGGAAGRTHRR
jgi:hypothetical protein